MVRIIDSLERDGLVARRREEADGRAKQIFLTEEEIEIMLSVFERLQPSLDNDESSDES